MSVIFGIRKPPSALVTEAELREVSRATERYAPDCVATAVRGCVGMGYQALVTHLRSSMEVGPVTDKLGNLVVLDGRLDNYKDLCEALDLEPTLTSDASIVLSAFQRWGTKCFSKLIGEWALALWSAREKAVYLARDHAGTRTLYYALDAHTLRWSTYVDTFLVGTNVPSFDDKYIAAYLALQPIRELTPYEGIKAVRPAHYLRVTDGGCSYAAHWQWTADGEISYHSDGQYEEHFLHLFRQSVARRTGPGAPVVAHLSGGMDSSAIVCVSDQLRQQSLLGNGLVDTLSFHDEGESTWNEKPFFTIVERWRGKAGIHVPVSFLERTFELPSDSTPAALFPGTDSGLLAREQRVHELLTPRGYRAVLAGHGGDELLGGVPTGLPELGGYLSSCRVWTLLNRTMEWCLVDRTPFLTMLASTVRFATEVHGRRPPKFETIAGWLSPQVRNLCQRQFEDDFLSRWSPSGPSAQINIGWVWWTLIDGLPHLEPETVARYEYRYPYLDRELVEYLMRVPRQQLIQPGYRRSMMKRSLRQVVPTEILYRKRKAYVGRGPIVALRQNEARIAQLVGTSFLVTNGWIKYEEFRNDLKRVVRGDNLSNWPMLLRAALVALWAQSLTRNATSAQQTLTDRYPS